MLQLTRQEVSDSLGATASALAWTLNCGVIIQMCLRTKVFIVFVIEPEAHYI